MLDPDVRRVLDGTSKQDEIMAAILAGDGTGGSVLIT